MSESETISPKSRLAAALLCFFLGVFGAHRFYVGKAGTGILMILTLGGVGIWALVDLIFIVTGSFRDGEGKRVYHWMEPPPV
ncbi:MAG: TM2 domain-containing protein [Deltaproteobacteria bacterium]|nr:MAG: TM2 domain-containing protein [Deltaproteobacteria bacterium]